MIRLMLIFLLGMPVTSRAVMTTMGGPMGGPTTTETCAKWLLGKEKAFPDAPKVVDAMIIKVDPTDNYIKSETGQAMILGEILESTSRSRVIYYLPVSMEELTRGPNRPVVIDEQKIRVTGVPAFIYGGYRAGFEFIGRVTMTIEVAVERESDFYTLSFEGVRPF